MNMMQARKYVIGLVMSVKQRRNLNSPPESNLRPLDLALRCFTSISFIQEFAFKPSQPFRSLTVVCIKPQKGIRENERNYRDRIRGFIQKKFFQIDEQILKLDNLVLSTESMM